MKAQVIEELKIMLARGQEIRRKIPQFEQILSDGRDSTDFLMESAILIDQILPANNTLRLQAQANVNNPLCGRSVPNIDSMIGIVKTVLTLEDKGLLQEPKYVFLVESFDNFLGYAEEYYNNQQKKESGALVGVVLEDTLKNIADKNEINRNLKMDQIITELVKINVFNKGMATRARSWCNVRNTALHADWDNLELTHVGEAINGCRELISNYL